MNKEGHPHGGETEWIVGSSPTMTESIATASLDETRYLLGSPVNAARLAESIAELEAHLVIVVPTQP